MSSSSKRLNLATSQQHVRPLGSILMKLVLFDSKFYGMMSLHEQSKISRPGVVACTGVQPVGCKYGLAILDRIAAGGSLARGGCTERGHSTPVPHPDHSNGDFQRHGNTRPQRRCARQYCRTDARPTPSW